MMNELIHDTTLYENIPSGEGRLPREMEVYKLLEQLNIPFKRMDHEPMATIEACQGVDKILGIHMCKNLFLCNSQKTVFYLHISPGAVSVMGLMNDKGNHVNLLINEDVLKEEFLGCHPCVNTASLRLKTSDVIEKFLPFTAHEYQSVHLTGED